MKEFRSQEDIERFIDSSYINLKDVRDYFKERGNFVFSSTTRGFNGHIGTFLMANRTLGSLQNFIKQEVYVKCSGFILETNLSLDELNETLKDARGDKFEEEATEPRIDRCGTGEDEEEINGDVVYHKSNRSNVNIFDSKRTSFEFSAEKIGENDDRNVYLVRAYLNYNREIRFLKRLFHWILGNDEHATKNIHSINFNTVEDVEDRHSMMGQVLSDVADFQLLGVCTCDAEEEETLTGGADADATLTEEWENMAGTVKMLSPNELLEFLQNHAKTCKELSLIYWKDEAASMFTVKDKDDLLVKLRDIREVLNPDLITTKSEYDDEDRLISKVLEEQRKEITGDYFREISLSVYEDIIS